MEYGCWRREPKVIDIVSKLPRGELQEVLPRSLQERLSAENLTRHICWLLDGATERSASAVRERLEREQLRLKVVAAAVGTPAAETVLQPVQPGSDDAINDASDVFDPFADSADSGRVLPAPPSLLSNDDPFCAAKSTTDSGSVSSSATASSDEPSVPEHLHHAVNL